MRKKRRAKSKMINYSELDSWRNLCEWLEGRWYNFAYISDIEKAREKGELKVDSYLYLSKGIRARSLLWLNYRIQFISYQLLPVVNHWSENRLMREFGEDVFFDCGWYLVSDWEFKIDFLEQLVLLNREEKDIPKLWISNLERRLKQRGIKADPDRDDRETERIKIAEEAIEQKQKAKDKRLQSYLNGFCGWCGEPIVSLMFDCPKCTKPYES